MTTPPLTHGRRRCGYSPPMHVRSAYCLVVCLAVTLADTVLARQVLDSVQIKQRPPKLEASAITNIQSVLALSQAVGQDLTPARFEYLLIQAPAQVRLALQPFGYYSPDTRIAVTRHGAHAKVILTVAPGQPVRVRRRRIVLTGWADEDRYLAEDIRQFRPKVGGVLNHQEYEASKLRISHRLLERGYFDADFSQRRIAIYPSIGAADIDLGWDSGRRYDMGAIHFQYDYFRPGLFDPLVYWKEGDYYHEGRLDRLRESLTKLDYFRTIEIQAKPEHADAQGRVPVDVRLERAKRTIYSAGVSYGTDSGPGIRLGTERRYINARGHKLTVQLNLARKHDVALATYKIPAFRWLDGWYALSARRESEQSRYIDIHNRRLTVARSGQVNRLWTVTMSLNLLQERWRYGDAADAFATHYDTATLVYPQLDGQYSNVDDAIFPRDGILASLTLRGGGRSLAMNTSFVQTHAKLRWFTAIGPAARLILRGEAGTTWMGDLTRLPPSLRYFAGGANSIRGYAYREVGPRTGAGFAVGAKRVVTAAAEYEYYPHGGPLGAAVFADGGSAFAQRPDWHTGVGVGLRYRSPVGPIRLDLATGLDHPHARFQLYIDVGKTL